MLKCEKERREIISNNVELVKACDRKIHRLEEKIAKHWGRKLAGNRKGVFDILPTPKEDPDGHIIKNVFSPRR